MKLKIGRHPLKKSLLSDLMMESRKNFRFSI